MQREAVADVFDAVELLRRRAPYHAVDLVALVEKQLGQVRTVLAGDASAEGSFWGHTGSAGFHTGVAIRWARDRPNDLGGPRRPPDRPHRLQGCMAGAVAARDGCTRDRSVDRHADD